jgi:hypothetical protein
LASLQAAGFGNPLVDLSEHIVVASRVIEINAADARRCMDDAPLGPPCVAAATRSTARSAMSELLGGPYDSGSVTERGVDSTSISTTLGVERWYEIETETFPCLYSDQQLMDAGLIEWPSGYSASARPVLKAASQITPLCIPWFVAPQQAPASAQMDSRSGLCSPRPLGRLHPG